MVVVRVHPDENLQLALDNATYNSILVLDSGQTYTGQFLIKPKLWASGWIYIISSAFFLQQSSGSVPAPGTRVTPSNAGQMAKIVSDKLGSPISFVARNGQPAAGHVRFVGLEITSSSTVKSNPDNKPWPINGQTPILVGITQTDNVTIDRSYIHGSDTVDVTHDIMAFQGASNIAVIDSWVSDAHLGQSDAQAFCMTSSEGPVKRVNNYFSGSTEDVMFGGAGANLPPPYNGYVPADIEIRGNHMFKPEEWVPRTTGVRPQWTVKNNLEFKSAKRVLVTGNTMENAWWSGQYGSNVLLTPRSYQSGPNTVIDDIDIEANVLLNSNWAFQIAGYDTLCNPPGCTNQGESVRVRIAHNMIKLRSVASAASYKPLAFSIGMRERDYYIYANTVVSIDNSSPWSTVYFNNSKCPCRERSAG